MAALCLLLAACSAGGDDRPTLGAEASSTTTTTAAAGTALPQPPLLTGVAEVDALLARLDAASRATFTATYDVLRRLGPVESTATVTQQPPRSALRVGDVVLLGGPDGQGTTCDLAAGGCTEGIEEQRLSDSVLTSGFWAAAPAAAIRTAMARRVADTALSRETIAGLTADCVAVPVAGGTDRYCVTPAGVLARADTAAMLIELTAWADTADPALLERPAAG